MRGRWCDVQLGVGIRDGSALNAGGVLYAVGRNKSFLYLGRVTWIGNVSSRVGRPPVLLKARTRRLTEEIQEIIDTSPNTTKTRMKQKPDEATTYPKHFIQVRP